jgi:hypothetical protein
MGFLNIGMRILPLIISAIEAVEHFKDAFGAEKEDAAVGMVDALLKAVEAGVNKDLLKDEDVAAAVRSVMQAIVHLQNVIKGAKGVE